MSRVVLIGTRGHVDQVLEGIGLVEGCELVGMAPADAQDDVLRFAGHRAWGPQTRAYEDYEQMLEEAKPDVACVFMQYYRNAEATIAAARRGIPVVCEKPVATRLEDLEQVRRAVERSGARLTALFSMRLLPEFAAVRRAVGEGLIGEPVLVFGQKSYRFGTRPEFFRRRETYGGTISWVAIHAIDFVRYCSGLEYCSVRALAANKAHPDYPGCEDCGGLLFEMSNGGQAVITFDYLRPGGAATHGDDRLRIAGSAGVAELRMAEGFCQVVTGDGVRALERPAGGQFFVDFVAELRGQGRHVVGPDEAIRVTEIALRARDAADTGQTVRL